MAGLLDWLSKQKDSAMSDYAGLMDNYPNAQKFGSGLINNISQHIPSNADFKSPEAMRDWGTAAALNAPMGLTFTGPKSMGWNHDAANTATKLLDNGADPAQVWKDHLIGRMPDGKLFSEIDDSGASHIPVSGMSSRISENLKHPELLGNYPYLDKISMSKGSSSYFSPELEHIKSSDYKTQAGVDPRELRNSNRLYAIAEKMDAKGTLNDSANNRLSNLIDKNESNPKYANFNEDTTLFGKSTTLHELQHAIQNQEGWARGGNAGMFNQQKEAELARDALNWRIELLRKRKDMPKADWHHVDNAIVQDYQKQGIFDWIPTREARDLASQPYILHADKYDNGAGLKDLEDLVKMYGLENRTSPYNPMEAYRRLTGEAQARATQDRMNMNMQQRRNNYPLAGGLLSDIPLDQLINRYR
jgi:hypothetical protein